MTKEQPQDPRSLRERAQERIDGAAHPDPGGPEQNVRLIEELRVHQVELELQNQELRDMQQQLLQYWENYRELFDFAPIPYLTLDRDKRITEGNNAAAELFGLAALKGTPVTRFIEEQSLAAFFDCCNRAHKSRQKSSVELLIRRSGAPLTVLMTVAVSMAREDESSFRVMFDDITRQKESERILAHSREYAKSIVETVRTPLVVVTRENFIIESANSAFFKMFAATAGEAYGLRLAEFNEALFGDERLLRRLEDTLGEGKELEGLDHECSLPGGIRHILLSGRPVRSSTDLMREKVLLTIDDITERKAAENNIRELNTSLRRRAGDLARVNKEMESFVYSVSHDLRAPLRSISGFAEIIKKDCESALNKRGKDFLARIVKASARMGGIIDDLLRLSQVSRQDLRVDIIDASSIVTDILEEIRAGDARPKVRFDVQQGVMLHADSALLRIALENLLRNAWKYTGKNEMTIIEFGSTSNRGSQTCFISDNGVGFRQEHAEKMFNSFQRLHANMDFLGTGVGLAIAKRIFDRHDGVIWANGQPDRGATIYFSLPEPKGTWNG